MHTKIEFLTATINHIELSKESGDITELQQLILNQAYEELKRMTGANDQ